MDQDFQIDFTRLPEQLLTLLTDPGTNLPAALALYAIIVILLLVILVIAVLLLVYSDDEDELTVEGTLVGEVAPKAATAAKPSAPRDPRAVLSGVAIAAGIALGVWLMAGYTTSRTAVCEGCHLQTPHTAVDAYLDPHTAVSCVSCHEPGGTIGVYVSDLPARLLHFADGVSDPVIQEEYGAVRQSACLSCHRLGIGDVVVNEERGLRMSHAEPLEASVLCMDCHTFDGGVVSAHNAGMNPCLRCHDSKTVSSDCGVCHDKNAAAAALASTESLAAVQIEQLRCGGCHDEQRQCDPCHGIRMPHEREFMAYAHARAAVVDIWFGDGTACEPCHTPTRRSCRQCHGSQLGRGHGPGLAQTHSLGRSAGCNTCHQAWSYSPQRDFCEDVCHTPAAIEYSPR